MYCKHHTKGIIISSRIEGDSNKLANIFTEDFGLINAKVQGARNIHSKLRSGCQDFSFSEFSLVHGRTGWKVVSARAEQNFFEVFRNSSEKLKIVGNILNLIKKLTAEEAHLNNEVGHKTQVSLFKIISNFFKFLISVEEKDIALAECLTLMRILHTLGFMRHDPELLIPMSSAEINIKDLEKIASRRSKMITLINESLKAA
jgi:DNA repair protein RecO